MRRLTQAGVRFLEASLEPWRDTSRRVLVDGAERERPQVWEVSCPSTGASPKYMYR